jgi:hypothetical protein
MKAKGNEGLISLRCHLYRISHSLPLYLWLSGPEI